MLNITSAIESSVRRHLTGLMLATVFVIGGSGVILGSINIRRSLRAPFATNGGNLLASAGATDTALDTDEDGLSDAAELNTFVTSPFLADSDSDGMSDGEEVAAGTDPNCPAGKTCGETIAVPESENAFAASFGSLLAAKQELGSAPSAEVLRQLLREGGVSEEEIAQFTDEEIVAGYQEARAAQGGNSLKDVENLSAAELRVLLRENGVDEATLNQIDDAAILKLYQDTLAEAKMSAETDGE